MTGNDLVLRLRLSRGRVRGAAREMRVVSAKIVGRNLSYSETLHGGKGDGSVRHERSHTLTLSELARIESLLDGAKWMESSSVEGPGLSGDGAFVDLDFRIKRGGQRHELTVTGATQLVDGKESATALAEHPLHLQLVALADSLSEIAGPSARR